LKSVIEPGRSLELRDEQRWEP